MNGISGQVEELRGEILSVLHGLGSGSAGDENMDVDQDHDMRTLLGLLDSLEGAEAASSSKVAEDPRLASLRLGLLQAVEGAASSLHDVLRRNRNYLEGPSTSTGVFRLRALVREQAILRPTHVRCPQVQHWTTPSLSGKWSCMHAS